MFRPVDMFCRRCSRGRRPAALLLAGAAWLAPPGGLAAEAVPGLQPVTDCASRIFLLSPGGSLAVSMQLGQGSSALGVDGWDLDRETTTSFPVPDISGSNVSLRETQRHRRLAERLDEERIAIGVFTPTNGVSHRVFDVAEGREVDQRPWVTAPSKPAFGYVSGHISMVWADRRGDWVARGWFTDEDAAAERLPIATGEKRIVAVNLRTGELKDHVHEWPDPDLRGSDAVWRIDRDGEIGLRMVGLQDKLRQLQIPEGDGWRTVLEFGGAEWLDPYPPADFGPQTQTILVVADVGREGLAAGRLDLDSGEIAYFPAPPGGARTAQFGPDQDRFLWAAGRVAGQASGGGFAVGGEDVPPQGGARAYEMSFADAGAERLYDALRGDRGHADILAWSDDGSQAIAELSSPDDWRAVEVVRIGEDGAVSDRRTLCQGR